MHDVENIEGKETMYLAGGLALLVLGAGMVMASPTVRRLLHSALAKGMPEGDESSMHSLGGMLPDVERYLKIRAM